MIVLGAAARRWLKKPLGKVSKTLEPVKRLSHTRRIVAVGDICTLAMLATGIRPHVAVFDHRYMRQDLNPMLRLVLDRAFRRRSAYRNEPGTLSRRLLRDAPSLLRKGGAVFIEGEEDLTALAFIAAAGKRDIVVYGQPRAGLVVVKPTDGLKKRIRKMLSSAALEHEVK